MLDGARDTQFSRCTKANAVSSTASYIQSTGTSHVVGIGNSHYCFPPNEADAPAWQLACAPRSESLSLPCRGRPTSFGRRIGYVLNLSKGAFRLCWLRRPQRLCRIDKPTFPGPFTTTLLFINSENIHTSYSRNHLPSIYERYMANTIYFEDITQSHYIGSLSCGGTTNTAKQTKR